MGEKVRNYILSTDYLYLHPCIRLGHCPRLRTPHIAATDSRFPIPGGRLHV